MRMGVREICDVVFRPLTAVDIGNQHFDAGQPVLYLDTAKTSTLEGAATTVYAQGGKGNPRLIGWDGEKTLTFTVEDALISAVSFSMLSGAGIVKGRKADDEKGIAATKIYAHQTYDLVVETKNGGLYAQLPTDVRNGATLVVSREAPVYATVLDSAGAPRTFLSAVTMKEIFTGNDASTVAEYDPDAPGEVKLEAEDVVWFKLSSSERPYTEGTVPPGVKAGNTVRIDCYTVHTEGAQEIQIDAENFAGYYYIEADTLFRDEATGQDLPAQFIIPRGKIQSNFTFTMANSGDPSTFTFTIDAFPAYTKFNKRKKVMAALQIIDPTVAGHNYEDKSIIGHDQRNAGVDIYGEGNEYTEGDSDQAKRNRVYSTSIFDEVGISNNQQQDGGNGGTGDGGSGNGEGSQGGEGGSSTTTDTYVEATEFSADATYYVKDGDNYVEADPKPTADNFSEGTYFIKG